MSMQMNMKERKRREKQLEKIRKWISMEKEVIVYNANNSIMGIGKVRDADLNTIVLEGVKGIGTAKLRGWYEVKVVNGS